MLRADPVTYTAILEEIDRHDLSDAEKQVFAIDHAQVGAIAAKRWNPSEAVCNMILYHHNPVDAPQATLVTHIINVADGLAYLKNQKLPFDENFFGSSSVITLKVTETQLEAIWERVLVNLREAVKGFFLNGGEKRGPNAPGAVKFCA